MKKKNTVEVAKSGKIMTFYESIRAFWKISKTTGFDHSNFRLFERTPAIPGTSNNRGLTVCYGNGSSMRHIYGKLFDNTGQPIF